MGLDANAAGFVTRIVSGSSDISALLRLRGRVFRGGGDDADRFDSRCQHLLVEERSTGALAATCRLLRIDRPDGLKTSYAAQFYDLSGLATIPLPALELGRFCLAEDQRSPDILRVAWAALADHIDRIGVGTLFGCTSFQGTDPTKFRHALDLLGAKYLGPANWPVGRATRETVALARGAGAGHPDPVLGLGQMPPLLRSYLTMGGWVSDHAVIDRDLSTVHVFTCVEIAKVSAARARFLKGAR